MNTTHISWHRWNATNEIPRGVRQEYKNKLEKWGEKGAIIYGFVAYTEQAQKFLGGKYYYATEFLYTIFRPDASGFINEAIQDDGEIWNDIGILAVYQ